MWIKFLILLMMTTPTWGYNLTQDFVNGFYWATLPINITVIDKDASRKEVLQNLAKNAISEWEEKSGLKLWDLKNSGTKNIIRWSSDFANETKMDPNSVLAVAIRYTDGPYFAKTEIIVNGQHRLNLELDNLQTTLTHELGHTMGLDHSNDMLAVMAPTLQDPYQGLQADDLSGMEDAFSQIHHRQMTGYVSPLSYKEKSSGNAMSCGTVAPSASSNGGALVSMSAGILIGFVRKILSWFKSLF